MGEMFGVHGDVMRIAIREFMRICHLVEIV